MGAFHFERNICPPTIHEIMEPYEKVVFDHKVLADFSGLTAARPPWGGAQGPIKTSIFGCIERSQETGLEVSHDHNLYLNSSFDVML